MDEAVRSRFEAKFEKHADGCWLWRGSKNEKGYGYFSVGGRLRRAHRVAYELYVGQIPDRAEVMHSCDVRHCVNPDHLTPGTHLQNMADCASRGRKPGKLGSANPAAKLAPADVEAIRERYAGGGITQARLGREYGVGQSQISNIVRGLKWSS